MRKTVSGTGVDYLYDLSGQTVAEVSATGGWNRGEVYAGGRNVATYNRGTTYFNHADWLGTRRAQSTVSGIGTQQCAGLPFGDGLSCVNGDNSPIHFAGLERDLESAAAAGTGLDHTWFRQYSSTQGRWMTPDPAGLAVVDPANPQSLNRYAYVTNTPTTLTDPYGLNADADWSFPCPFSAAWCYQVGSGFASTSWDGYQTGGGGMSAGAAEIEAAKNGYVYGVLASIYGDKNVASTPNGFLITFHVSYLGPCGPNALPDCLTRLTHALFEFLNPSETKSFSFDTSFRNTVAAFERSGINPSPLDNKYNPWHDFSLRDTKNLCSVHVDLNSTSGGAPGQPTTGTVHIDAINPLFSIPGHTIQDVVPYLLRKVHIPVPPGSSTCP